MPTVDPSLAWGRVIIQYSSPVYDHVFSFHCREMSASGNWIVPDGLELNVEDTILALLDLMPTYFAAGTTFTQYQVYRNEPGALPATFWLTGQVPTLTNPPTGVLNPAGQLTLSFRSASNRKLRFVTLDCNGGIELPFLIVGAEFASATLALATYILGNDNLVTIDGERPVLSYALTGTINKTLERRYGKKANQLPQP